MKAKIVFFCTECGQEMPRWQGKCPGCGSWNTIVEQPSAPKSGGPARRAIGLQKREAVPISAIEETLDSRILTGMGELDRILGGGMVAGSVNLVAGEPGIGKSTLLLQICQHLCTASRVLYVTGEESERQIKMRARRLGVQSDELFVLAETDIDDILAAMETLGPSVVIVDSIQTVARADVSALPGNVAQVRECTMALMQVAKSQGIAMFIVGHVNKEGSIAGPKVLEHMVDCVLYFEGERHMAYRIVRAAKNRFGSTNEIGVFEMGDKGLSEVPNPSEMLLAGRPTMVPGACVACVMEGSRPVLAEIQALAAPTSFGQPRRTVSGFDYNRAMLLLAVLEKRAGMFIGSSDVYINVVGGLRLDETACDLPAVLAVASSFRDKPLDASLAAIGEIGLTGEIRPVSALTQRLEEIRRLGFTSCIIPERGSGEEERLGSLRLLRAATLREAIDLAVR